MTDLSYARSFDAISFIETVLEQLACISGRWPDTYDANYVKEWKTWKGFSNGASKLPELANAYFSYGSEGGLCSYENSLVGFYEPPAVGSISLFICCPESVISIQQLIDLAIDLAKNLGSSFPFEYGYAHSLSDDFEPSTETKYYKTFGGRGIKSRPADSIWIYHMLGIRHGCLRSVYPKNILNSSQTSNPILVELLSHGVGTLESFTEGLTLWSIPEDQINRALEALAATGSIIWHDKGRDIFLQRSEAREYYEAMSPRRLT